jgi:hypothetical protein
MGVSVAVGVCDSRGGSGSEWQGQWGCVAVAVAVSGRDSGGVWQWQCVAVAVAVSGSMSVC